MVKETGEKKRQRETLGTVRKGGRGATAVHIEPNTHLHAHIRMTAQSFCHSQPHAHNPQMADGPTASLSTAGAGVFRLLRRNVSRPGLT